MFWTRAWARVASNVPMMACTCFPISVAIVRPSCWKGVAIPKHTICPLHRWGYDAHGKLLGAPRFKENPCLHLPETPITNWNGMLFESGRDIEANLKDLGVKPKISIFRLSIP